MARSNEGILEKEDEKIQEHNKGGKSRTETSGWSKTGDEEVDNTCYTSARLCPSSPLDVHRRFAQFAMFSLVFKLN